MADATGTANANANANTQANGGKYEATYRSFVNLSGYMFKRTKRFKLKKKCFVRLNAANLSCYPSRESEVVSWQFSIRQAKFEFDEATLMISISTPQKSVVLYAENKLDFKKWSKTLMESSLNNVNDFYELGDLVGKGAYGEVREAFDRKTGEKRAVKIMERTTDSKELEFLRREVNVMRSLMHPNIIRTFDIFDTNKTLYVVMEFIGGGDLFEVISTRAEEFSEREAANVVKEILEGIKYLHDRNIAHRDIKPENILCVSDSFPLRIKLTDFGFANYKGSDQMLTFIGTPFYMAPEIIQNKGHGPAVDIYAVGIVAYAMLSGRLPFETEDMENAYKMIVSGKITFPDAEWRSISPEARDFVQRCLAWEPTERPDANQALAHEWLKPPPESAKVHRLDSDLSRLAGLTTSKRASYQRLPQEVSSSPTRPLSLGVDGDDDDDDDTAIRPTSEPTTSANPDASQ